MSRRIDSADDLPQAYEQARKAVTRRAAAARGVGADATSTTSGVFRLLSLVPDTAELRSFVSEALGELVDRRQRGERRPARAPCGCCSTPTATSPRRPGCLHFHYNTLRYRIVKLERMLGPFTTDANLRLTLALALQVVQMRGI